MSGTITTTIIRQLASASLSTTMNQQPQRVTLLPQISRQPDPAPGQTIRFVYDRLQLLYGA